MYKPNSTTFTAISLATILSLFCFSGKSVAGWHPDPDGDGIPSSNDLCPYIYDPQQGDSDGDGIGNYCDSDFAPPVRNGRITDFRIEHITPYGAWLSFTSPFDIYSWGWDAIVAWSTNPKELQTATGFAAAANRGDTLNLGRIHADYGEKILDPIILTRLSPNTTYYVAVTRGSSGDGYDSDTISNIVSFKTTTLSMPTPTAIHPRVYVTPTYIQTLKARRTNGDTGWTKWEDRIRARTRSEHTRRYCFDAALLYQVTGNSQDLETAKSIFDNSVDYWEDNNLTRNEFRWENAQLGACLDLLWNDLSSSQRNRAVSAFLEDDEYNISDYDLRFEDTDEFASFTRNWIVDGLVACNASGIDSSLANRACKVLEKGHRLWHGVQLVKARREQGKYAQSGGFKPDGTAYGQNTQLYWLETFLALSNAGESLGLYGQYIENSLSSMFVHLLTPTQKGYYTIGDVEAYTDNFSIEPNSYKLRVSNGGVLGMFSGLLAKAGRKQSAGWAKYVLNKLYDNTPLNKVDGTTVYRLMFETDSLPAVDYTNSLDTFFHAKGFGMVFDRTSWKENASFLVFRAGWNFVDHIHADVGHFQLFRNGQWLTHESIAYSGLASCLGHNIWVLKTGESNASGDACPGKYGQNYWAQSDNTKSLILRSSSGSAYTYTSAEIAGAYNIFKENDLRNFKSVQRSLLWLKDNEGNGTDILAILDRIETSPDADADAIGYFQLHMDEAPSINGHHAQITLGNQQLIVDVASPETATMSSVSPTGSPGGNNDRAIYTHRLRIEPGKSKGLVNMITILRGSNASLELAPPTTVTTDKLQGAFVEGSLILMPTAAIKENGSSLSSDIIKLPTTQALKLFITGLLPETGYTLRASQSGKDLTITLTAKGDINTDEGGVLSVYINSARKISPIEITSTIFSNGFETIGG